ncbi:MAG: PorP/SprF family type IX secretion system membrane protein [Saprospiraceae bacterium]
MKKIGIWGLFLSTSLVLNSQDYRYNFANSSSSQLNPALIGAFEGDLKIGIQYRNLFGTLLQEDAFKGYSIAVDYKMQDQRGNFLGWNIGAHQNNHPRSNFQKSELMVGFAYHKKIASSNRSNSHYLTAGFQAGIGQHRLNANQLWFSNQWDIDAERINLDIQNGENWTAQTSSLFPDFQAGILWSGVFNKDFSAYLGGSAFHVAKPNISLFEGSTYQLERRWVIHGGINYYFNKNIGILPNFVWMSQSYGTSLTLGNYLAFKGNGYDEIGFRVGGFLHQSNYWTGQLRPESMAVAVMMQRDPIQFGVNYEFTISELSAVNQGRGAVEFQIILIFRNSESRIKYPSISF